MRNRFNPKVLNILNGGAMCQYLSSLGIDISKAVPFNEAMCVGNHVQDVFSDDFISVRCQSLEIRRESYMEEICIPLLKLLAAKDTELDLWFDEDMFCQVNLLVLLTYLEQIKFDRPIHLNLVSPAYDLIERVPIKLGEFQNIYNSVMIQHRMPKLFPFAFLEHGITLYLDYLKPQNKIVSYINDHIEEDRESLIEELQLKFKAYGLGDLQYIKLIESLS